MLKSCLVSVSKLHDVAIHLPYDLDTDNQ